MITMRAVVFTPASHFVDPTFRTALLSRRWDLFAATSEEELVALVIGLRPDLVIVRSESMTLAASMARAAFLDRLIIPGGAGSV